MSGSERGAASIDVDDDDPGTAGDAGTAAGIVVDSESAASTRPELLGGCAPKRHLRVPHGSYLAPTARSGVASAYVELNRFAVVRSTLL